MKHMTTDARHFVQGVVEYLRKDGRASTALPRVRTLFRKVTASAKEQNQAWVESAVVLTAKEKAILEQALAQLVGHSVSLHFDVKSSLVAGLRIRVADWIVDTTAASQLENMRELLN